VSPIKRDPPRTVTSKPTQLALGNPTTDLVEKVSIKMEEMNLIQTLPSPKRSAGTAVL
jgi:hypothetical protein